MYMYMYVYVYVDMDMDIWYTYIYIYICTFTYGTHGRLKLYFGLVQRRKYLVTIDPFHYSYVLPESKSVLCAYLSRPGVRIAIGRVAAFGNINR